MKLYKEDKQYFWEFDRFHFFTESEKCGLLDALESILRISEKVADLNMKGGVNEMTRCLINELNKSLE